MILYKNLYKKIYLLIKSFEKKIFILGILIFFSSIIEIIGISAFLPIISKTISYQESPILLLNKIYSKFTLNDFLVIILLIYSFKFLILTFITIFRANILKRINHELSYKLLNKYLLSNYSFFLKFSSSSLIRNINIEIPNFVNKIILSITNLFSDILVCFFILIFLLFVSFNITFFVFVFFLLFSIIYIFFFKKKIEYWSIQRLIPEKLRIQYLQEIFNGIREIKIFRISKYYLYKFKINNYNFLRLWSKEAITIQTPRLFLEIIVVLGFAGLIYVLSKLYNTEEIILILGLYGISVFRILPAVSRIITSINTLKFGKSNIDLLFDEFFLKEEVNVLEKSSKIFFNNEIEFRNVCFNYDNSKKIIENINIKFKKNDIIGIVGESGSGKSTLLDIIIGLLSPTSGEIFIDKVLKPNDVIIQNATYVSQNTFIINDSIERNILMETEGDPLDEKLLKDVIVKANLDKFVSSCANGSKTILGEGNRMLSGGERQRIGIARALYKKPKLLLLDEFTNSLDGNNEKEILKVVGNLKKDIAIILISHSSIPLSICDQKYQLKNLSIQKIYE
jgi:ABC-type branched-subunit amino acid transport system ATPase component